MTKDPQVSRVNQEVSRRIGSIDVTNALAILTEALERCRDQDMRTPDVFAAWIF
jgi:hypothetical protein